MKRNYNKKWHTICLYLWKLTKLYTPISHLELYFFEKMSGMKGSRRKCVLGGIAETIRALGEKNGEEAGELKPMKRSG